MIQLVATLLGYLFLAIAMFGFLGLWIRRARFVARLLLFYTAMFGCTGYGVFATLLLRMVGKVSIAQYAVGRAFKHVICPLVGIDIPVENEKALEVRPAVFISNHQSELDLVLLGRLFPKHCSVTAKRSLKYVPFLGWFMAVSGTVFIDRTNRKDAFTAFERASKEMQDKKQSVWIFPEGTRSYTDQPLMLPFKKGAFHLALQAKVPIVPIVIANYSHVLNVKAMTFEKGSIPVRVLDPISTEGLTSADIPKLVEDTRKKMIEVLEEITPKKIETKKSD